MTKARSVSTGAAAKGDLVAGTGTNTSATLGVGSNNQTILADSTATTGMKWAASPTSVLGTTGDILYASAANTLAALSAGSSGQVLTSNGAGVAPSYQTVSGGGMTLLGTGAMTGVSTYTFSSIPQTYNRLYVRLSNISTTTSSDLIYVRVNGNAVSNGYHYSILPYTATASTNTPNTFISIGVGGTGNWSTSGGMFFHDYTLTTSTAKVLNWNITSWKSGTSATGITGWASCSSTTASAYDGIGAVTSIQFYNSAANNFSAGNIYLYGEK